MDDEGDIALFESLLAKHLSFYEALRLRRRRPKTAAQREFQDVAWGRANPQTVHEKAYIYYLKQHDLGPFAPQSPEHPAAPSHLLPRFEDKYSDYPPGTWPISHEIGRKWDESFEPEDRSDWF
jgi:hypothetical protein